MPKTYFQALCLFAFLVMIIRTITYGRLNSAIFATLQNQICTAFNYLVIIWQNICIISWKLHYSVAIQNCQIALMTILICWIGVKFDIPCLFTFVCISVCCFLMFHFPKLMTYKHNRLRMKNDNLVLCTQFDEELISSSHQVIHIAKDIPAGIHLYQCLTGKITFYLSFTSASCIKFDRWLYLLTNLQLITSDADQ